MLEILLAALLALFVGLQVAVPIKVRGAARVVSVLPIAILLLVSGVISFFFRHAEGGWAAFPTFLFLLVGLPAATIALVFIWVVFHFDNTKKVTNGHRPNP